MPELSRTQVVVYGAIAVALLLVGAQAIRGEGGGSGGAEETTWSDPGSGTGDSAGGAGEFELSGEAGDVVVDVTGAVQRPGVYRLPAGSRVTDAVQRAGGVAPKAQLEAVNLAARLADGQQVVVPERGPGGATTAAGAASEDGPISLGTASVEQLDQISGIGPATMEALRARLQP